MNKITRGMIFSAGLGTRFKPWTDNHPKALAVVNGKSLLQRNIEYLQQYGIYEVVVNIHHFADQVIKSVEENKGWGSEIIFSDETSMLLETGGGLMKARKHLENFPFVIVNADILTSLDINKLNQFKTETGALISFGIQNRETSRYFLFNDQDTLCGWRNINTGEEKIVRSNEKLRPMAYSCVAIFSPAFFNLVKQEGKFSLTETYLDLAASHLINGYDHTGDNFIDVGKPESVATAEKMFE